MFSLSLQRFKLKLISKEKYRQICKIFGLIKSRSKINGLIYHISWHITYNFNRFKIWKMSFRINCLNILCQRTRSFKTSSTCILENTDSWIPLHNTSEYIILIWKIICKYVWKMDVTNCKRELIYWINIWKEVEW